MRLGSLSDKQKIALRDSMSRLNFWIGSVRSGKSFSALLRFMQMCSDKTIEGDFVVVGKTEGSLKRNIISEMYNLAGNDCRYSSGNREIILYKRKIHVVGANDDRAEGKIRGASFGGALVDEVTLIPENFFAMLLSRLSKKNARLLVTTNPDSPFCWFKTKYLDRAEEIDAKIFNFYLDDNPSLSEEYKKALEKEYTGLYYDRFILGKWVLAEGTVYNMFDKDIHVIEQRPAQANFYVVGVDVGTVNPTAFCMIGYNPNVYPNCWIEKEFYYDSRAEMRQKTDTEYVNDLANFINGFYVRSIQVDPSAASFKLECFRAGITSIADADNDVLDGIRLFANYLNNGTLKICSNCTNTLKEIQTYVWDETAKNRGVEKPKKENDHCLDSARYGVVAMDKYIRGVNVVKNDQRSTYSGLNQRFMTRF